MKIEKQINLELTQISGQTSQPPWFKTEKKEYWDIIKTNNTPILIKLSQKNINSLNAEYETITDTKISDKKIENEIKRIYDLDFNLEKFYNTLDTEFNLPDAIEFCKGLRLFLAKDPFEAIISSISSSNNSIKRWTNSINTIKHKWGDQYQFPSGKFYTFPKPKTLLNTFKDDTEEHEHTNKKIENCTNNLKACGVGYRDKYIQETSKILTNNIVQILIGITILKFTSIILKAYIRKADIISFFNILKITKQNLIDAEIYDQISWDIVFQDDCRSMFIHKLCHP